jgi:hypothetical protein
MKYLNTVLTVIAVCLVLITFAVTGILPSAKAGETGPRFVSVPVNPDGSVTVKFLQGQTIDVNIDEINGSSVSGSKLPIATSSAIDVNIEEIDGRSVTFSSLPVKLEK